MSLSSTLLLGLFLVGCKPLSVAAPQAPLPTVAELQPEKLPYAKGTLDMGGTKIPVEVQLKQKQSVLQFDLYTHRELIEQEKYVQTADGFALTDAAEETFEPPVPLLVPNMHGGEGWKWSGKMTSGGISRAATGEIAAKLDTPKALAGESAVQVSLTLHIAADPGRKPIVRVLKFWFAKGRGLLGRDFAGASIRAPGEE